MQDLSREAILRMVGLHDSAQFMRQINAIQLSLEEQNGQMVAYWTEIQKDERQISLIAGRMTDAETNIGQLQVTAQQITASVSSLNTTVNGDGTQGSGLVSQVSSLSLTVGNINLSVQSLSTTVNGDGTQGSGLVSRVSSLELSDTSIKQRVKVIEDDYVTEGEISLMVKKDGNGYISNASIKADRIDFTFTRSTNFISNGTTVMNINSSGDLWIKGEYKGGNLTGAMNVGAINAQRKFIITPSDTSGRATISGYDGNNEVIKLGWTYSDPHPVLSMDNDPSILLYSTDHSKTCGLDTTGFSVSYNSYILSIGIGSSLANIILHNGLRFPTLTEADTILASTSYITGVIYMDNDHFLKVRDANG